MASEETSEMIESSKPQLDNLHFVDHVETIIKSPEKEVISPTKLSIKGSFTSPTAGLNGKINENETIDSTDENAKGDHGKEDQNETKSSDSGLDSSNISSETSEEHFIDRQESYTAVEEPEVLSSPNKTVDKLFNFLDSSSTQSLDALNNNSEVIIGENKDDDSNKDEVVQTDVYLGKEVALHGGDNGKAQNVENKVTDDTSMNLYWYTSSLDVDMAELEQFKTSQAEESKMTENITTNLQITVGNGYYKAKNIEVDLEPQSESVYTSETSIDIKSTPVKRDSWSPAFESASSRILDLASEMKSEPKHKKDRENESIKSAADVEIEKHPWGLDSDYKVVSESVTESHDELPDIGEMSSRDDTDGTYQSEDSVAFIENEGLRITEGVEEDEADAIGYMELADKPIVEEVASKSSKSEKDKVSEQEDKVKTIKVDKDKQEIKVCSEDVADAVGYMEWKDKPVDDAITVSEQTLLESVECRSTERTVGEVKSEVSSVTSIESQILGQTAMVESSQKSKAAAEGIDSPDAQLNVIEKSENIIVQASVQESLREEVEIEQIPFDPFDIKRKYIVGNDSERAVEKMGGKFIETETLVDEYLDDVNYTLLLNDCWLRLRNKKFEMKVNAAFGCGPNISPSVEMLTIESDIQEMLMTKFEKTLEQKRRVSERHLDVLIDALGFSEFVTFETTRKKFLVDGFTVTLDTTNFGFQVGEIEIVANSLPEMMTALKNMDNLAAKLGMV